jgi:hypothetical protein
MRACVLARARRRERRKHQSGCAFSKLAIEFACCYALALRTVLVVLPSRSLHV